MSDAFLNSCKYCGLPYEQNEFEKNEDTCEVCVKVRRILVREIDSFIDSWVEENMDEGWSACLYFEDMQKSLVKKFE